MTQAIAGWRIIISDAGRLWASRMKPFSTAQVRAGAFRTVDADDLQGLVSEIAEQERRGEAVA